MQEHTKVQVREAVIRFAGDSGDGMQLTGTQFAQETAFMGNDLVTFPNFPAEIRAPAGTLFGVSSYQIKIGENHVWSPGDLLDSLVVMNPAALKVHLQDLKPGGTLIINTDAFTERNLKKAHYETSPLEDPALEERYKVLSISMTSMVQEALKDHDVSSKEADRSKNMFALGVISHMYQRDVSVAERWLQDKFSRMPEILDANLTALKAGVNFAENSALMGEVYVVEPARMTPGKYRNVNGNTLLAYGLITAAQKADKPLMLGSYPITPASDILHELAKHKRFGVRTYQAEDEIAAVCAAIGASYAGGIGVTTTSGPGIALKGEAIGLAVMTELPLVVVNVQRGGPSTGLPTKTEQADLLQVMYGRNGESPLVVLAASTPQDAFELAYEAVRIAVKYMTPVVLLSDGYIANGAAPWRIPNPDDIPEIHISHDYDPENFQPYSRDPETLARPWALPGTPGLEHRIGGLEKEDGSGGVSYDPANHQKMVELRAEKIKRVQGEIPALTIEGDADAEILVVGWGSTYGSIQGGVQEARDAGCKVASIHLHYISPLPADLGDVLARYDNVLVPELNMGQLAHILRAEYLCDVIQLNKVQGLPLAQGEIKDEIIRILGEQNA